MRHVKKHTAIKYERRSHPHTGAPIYTAIVHGIRVDVWNNRRLRMTKAVRVIKEGGGYRADFANAVAGVFMPWEPITDTSYRSATAAKQAVREYLDDYFGEEPKE